VSSAYDWGRFPATFKYRQRLREAEANTRYGSSAFILASLQSIFNAGYGVDDLLKEPGSGTHINMNRISTATRSDAASGNQCRKLRGRKAHQAQAATSQEIV